MPTPGGAQAANAGSICSDLKKSANGAQKSRNRYRTKIIPDLPRAVPEPGDAGRMAQAHSAGVLPLAAAACAAQLRFARGLADEMNLNGCVSACLMCSHAVRAGQNGGASMRAADMNRRAGQPNGVVLAP